MARKDDFTAQIDIFVGKKIAEERIYRGLSRAQLSVKIGVTHQQLQKYEHGSNRISVGRLAKFSLALKKPISWFFEGVHDTPEPRETQHQRMCIEVSRNFMRIKKATNQNAVNILVRTLAED